MNGIFCPKPMKKIIAAFFLLLCVVVMFLATVDLGPYLAPHKAALPASGNITRQKPAPATANIEATEKSQQREQAQSDIRVNDISPESHVDELFPEQEQVVMAPRTKTAAVVDKTASQISLSPIELEVTTLSVGDYPFSILVGTFLKKEVAQRAISLYQKRGISTYWVKVDLEEKGVRYRQFTGFFSTMPEAQQYLEQNELVGKLIKPTYFAALVGVYTNKTELAGAFIKASQADVMPYILGTAKGDYFLYVGAFYTYIGAVDQCSVLTTAGLTCEPVKRTTIRPQ